jgi:hypothetical protein
VRQNRRNQMSAPLNSVFIDILFRIGFIERNAADRRLKWFDTGVPAVVPKLKK